MSPNQYGSNIYSWTKPVSLGLGISKPVVKSKADLHMTLALSVMYVNGFVVRQLDPTETAPHLARACRIVNQKLSGCDATSDLTIATVLSMSIYERLQGHYEIGLTHLRGLKSIVELRGGISQFAENAHLIQKIFR